MKRGHHVRGLTRNTDSEAARELINLGAELVTGNFTDQASLVNASTGVDTVFLMTTPFEAGIDAETAQGLKFVEAARTAGVGHIVFSSVASANLNTGIPHFDSKYAVEKAIAESGIPYSILAPVYFMENNIGPWSIGALKEGKLSVAMPGDVPLQMVSLQTIGQIATTLIEKREAVFSRRFDIATDNVSGIDTATILADASGTEIVYEGFSPDFMREENEDFAIMFDWFVASGYSVNIAELRAEFPQVAFPSLKQWAEEQDWAALGFATTNAVV